MSDPVAHPFGSWPSPITAELIVAGAASVRELGVDGDEIWWSEGRPSEGGRTQIVRRTPDGKRHEVLPEGWNARTQVHEYGGGAWTVARGVLWFSAWTDQRIHRLDVGNGQTTPHPITPEPDEPRSLRYADATVTPDGRWLVCVRESHGPGREAVNEIIAIAAEGPSKDNEEIRVLVSGADFVASPRVSPDGKRLAWIQWNHPNMPWDGTELWWAPVNFESGECEAEVVAGGPDESIVQPQWTPGGGLLAASDRSGWWNVHRFTGGDSVLDDPENLTPIDAEIGGPHWVFGESWYTVMPDDTLVVVIADGGTDHLGFVSPGSNKVEQLDTGFTSVAQVRAIADNRFAFVAAGPTTESAPFVGSIAAEGFVETEQLRPHRDLSLDANLFSAPEPIEFPTVSPDGGTRTAHALLYRPTNPHAIGPPGDLPPLLVLSHGGPTSAARPMLDLAKQFWTSRGFAVVDVNYGGSVGYGRPYRERLDGMWGVTDVDDCVAAAQYLTKQGIVDRSCLAIRGASAGGYTTLCALAFRDTFSAGASHFGVADCEALARDTHKFESRYLDRLIGPYPEEVDLYRERSPIHHTNRFNCPLIVLQGLEDEVVPPSQAEMIVAALRAKELPVAYVPFDGEQHGFRQAANIARALEAELWFYSRVFGFDPADPIEPVADASGLQ